MSDMICDVTENAKRDWKKNGWKWDGRESGVWRYHCSKVFNTLTKLSLNIQLQRPNWYLCIS